MDKEIKVSVILPSYNVVKYIRECIESVVNQSLQDIEIICVDAGSTDGTLEIIRDYETKDERIKVIVSDKKSYGYQMNIGIAAAVGEYIGIVETDDYILREMYEHLYRVAKENSADFVKADYYNVTGNNDELKIELGRLTIDYTFYNRIINIEEEQDCFRFIIMNTWTGIYNRAFLLNNNILHNETPGASFQDTGFWFQTFIYAKRAYFLGKPYYMHRRDNPDSSIHSKSKVFCICDEYNFIRDLLRKDEKLYQSFKFTYTYECYKAYKGTLNRIADKYKESFLQRFAEDFHMFCEQGEVDSRMFDKKDWEMLLNIMESPSKFYRKYSFKKTSCFKEKNKFIFNNTVEPWEKPAQELHKKAEFICEMSDQDHAFLCGLMKDKAPKKVLEIGVAEGGTTAVIVNCLSLLGNACEIYSVDLSESCYYDEYKKTGYEYERLAQYIDRTNITHHILLGKLIANQLEEIGGGIDFAIIDTTHQLPGELLDFLCILPYLTKDAMVVLHDVDLNYIRAAYGTRRQVLESRNCVSTKLLFSAVTAEKYLSMNQNGLFNIAAFMVSEDTHKYIKDLFYLLTSTWSYILEDNLLKEYRDVYGRYYDKDSLKLYDIAVANNQKIFKRMHLAQISQEEELDRYQFPYDKIPAGSRIVLYGAGVVGREIYKTQINRGLYYIVAWIDQNYKQYINEGLNVESPESIENKEFDFIVVAVKKRDIFKSIQRDIILNKWDAGKPIIGPILMF